jgi:hypothetical protein
MIAYLGCALFGLIFLLLSAKSGGILATRTGQTVDWMRERAPYSYLILVVLVLAALACIHIMYSWPKHKEPEDPMARYRHAADDVMED